MRTLRRNKRRMWYALYLDREEIKKNGRRTGTYKVVYSPPQLIEANVSAARGTADVEMFGTDLKYDKAFVMDDVKCPIDENSVMWIDTEPLINADGNTETPWDYVIVRVAESINSKAYAVKKVSVSKE